MSFVTEMLELYQKGRWFMDLQTFIATMPASPYDSVFMEFLRRADSNTIYFEAINGFDGLISYVVFSGAMSNDGYATNLFVYDDELTGIRLEIERNHVSMGPEEENGGLDTVFGEETDADFDDTEGGSFDEDFGGVISSADEDESLVESGDSDDAAPKKSNFESLFEDGIIDTETDKGSDN